MIPRSFPEKIDWPLNKKLKIWNQWSLILPWDQWSLIQPWNKWSLTLPKEEMVIPNGCPKFFYHWVAYCSRDVQVIDDWILWSPRLRAAKKIIREWRQCILTKAQQAAIDDDFSLFSVSYNLCHFAQGCLKGKESNTRQCFFSSTSTSR